MSKKLLLADDSVTIQKVMQITFAHEDYDLTITGNGDEAFQQALDLKPDLVLADVYMPGKNGYELCAALKQNPLCKNVPVLLLAGSFEPFDEDKARAAGADAWLEKPFESQTLIDKVAELLAAVPAAPAETTTPVTEPAWSEQVPAAPFAAAAEPEDGEEFLEDHFGTISFDEDLPGGESEADEMADEISDDWGSLAAETTAEPAPAEAAAERTESEAGGKPMADFDFSFDDEPLDESFADPAEETFGFEDEAMVEESSAAEVEPDIFDENDDDEDIMVLDDDDILGSEDLEPLTEEPTLSAWSRDDFVMDDALMEPAEIPASEEPAAAPTQPVFQEVPPAAEQAPLEETPPADEVAPQFVERAPSAEYADFAEFEPETLKTPAPADSRQLVEEQAARLSDSDIEAIVEKVVGKVIDRLADSILERVAWEVVPDLAEALIKQEINKIKQAAA